VLELSREYRDYSSINANKSETIGEYRTRDQYCDIDFTGLELDHPGVILYCDHYCHYPGWPGCPGEGIWVVVNSRLVRSGNFCISGWASPLSSYGEERFFKAGSRLKNTTFLHVFSFSSCIISNLGFTYLLQNNTGTDCNF
jgi:hypothetical protein